MAATERKIPGTFAPVPGGYSQQIGANTALFVPDFPFPATTPAPARFTATPPIMTHWRPPKPPPCRPPPPASIPTATKCSRPPRAATTPPILPTMASTIFCAPCVTACPRSTGAALPTTQNMAPTWSRSAPMTKSRRSTKSSAKLALIDPQGRRITRRRCKPGHPARGGRSWVTNTITSPAQIYNAHPSPTMAASPLGRWHKSNGSRYISPQNRLYPPPGGPGTVYGQLIITKQAPPALRNGHRRRA